MVKLVPYIFVLMSLQSLGQDLIKEVKECVNYFNNKKSIGVFVDMEYFVNSNSVYSAEFAYAKSDSSFYVATDEGIQIVNSNYSLYLSNDNKTMMVSPITKDEFKIKKKDLKRYSKMAMELDTKSQDTSYNFSFIGRSGNVSKYTFESDVYETCEVGINVKTDQFVYFKFSLKGGAVIKLNYSYMLNKSNIDSLLDMSQYFTKSNNKLEPTKKYARYQLKEMKKPK